ncbi:hypothetical protein Sme01_03310 [Sphaerisporangium melleum]|uniref:Uncharacterized protein n=1 Tax=Sphaerisporangium melleum TaxID=321316 RepID=A0A917VCL6_9ACTN|nr:hypothetical protein [Sphaerisporangium melleum]GGK61552.1 hypothetical protein GCM10007964_00850 [Sphaerisporangium melleum]GII67855.1 hypothetical protein Sme01_03310 [Sphaerisporangium melleum]
MDEKLTDIEREVVQKASSKLSKWSIWSVAAAVVCTAAAIWFGDWRPFGIALLLVLVAVAFVAVNHELLAPKNEAKWAKHMRTTERAKKAREEQRRRRVEDLERDLFGSEG